MLVCCVSFDLFKLFQFFIFILCAQIIPSYAQAQDIVIEGQDGWIIYVYEDDVGNLYDFNHQGIFSDNNLIAAASNMQALQDKLHRRGILFEFVIAPNTTTVYPESVPWPPQIENPISRREQLTKYLQDKTSVHLIDLYQDLEKNKDIGRLYHKTDTHWNDLGAYVAYDAIMKSLMTKLPQFSDVFTPLPLVDFDVTQVWQEGDLAFLLGKTGLFLEQVLSLYPKQGRYARHILDANQVWSWRNQEHLTERSDLCPDGPRILVFHDSFFMALQPYLSEHFCRVKFFWSKYIDWKQVDEEKPDILIYMTVERYLSLAIDGLKKSVW